MEIKITNSNRTQIAETLVSLAEAIKELDDSISTSIFFGEDGVHIYQDTTETGPIHRWTAIGDDGEEIPVSESGKSLLLFGIHVHDDILDPYIC